MDDFVKLPKPFLYEVDGSYQFLICTELKFIAASRQTELKGQLYSYENEELVDMGEAVVVLDGKENIVLQIDENGNYVD